MNKPLNNDTTIINVRNVDVSTYQKIKVLAAIEGLTIAEAITKLMDNYEQSNGQLPDTSSN